MQDSQSWRIRTVQSDLNSHVGFQDPWLTHEWWKYLQTRTHQNNRHQQDTTHDNILASFPTKYLIDSHAMTVHVSHEITRKGDKNENHSNSPTRFTMSPRHLTLHAIMKGPLSIFWHLCPVSTDDLRSPAFSFHQSHFPGHFRWKPNPRNEFSSTSHARKNTAPAQNKWAADQLSKLILELRNQHIPYSFLNWRSRRKRKPKFYSRENFNLTFLTLSTQFG